MGVADAAFAAAGAAAIHGRLLFPPPEEQLFVSGMPGVMLHAPPARVRIDIRVAEALFAAA